MFQEDRVVLMRPATRRRQNPPCDWCLWLKPRNAKAYAAHLQAFHPGAEVAFSG